jgi:hypothetical protein
MRNAPKSLKGCPLRVAVVQRFGPGLARFSNFVNWVVIAAQLVISITHSWIH